MVTSARSVPPPPPLRGADQEIRFCRSADGTRLAYAVHGSGPPLVIASCWLSHLQHDWRSTVWRISPQFGVELDDLTAVARASSDLRGLIGIDDAAPDLGDLSLDITISSGSPQDRIAAMFEAWKARCPMYLALLKPNAIALTTSVAA
jgi:hypothetical protein